MNARSLTQITAVVLTATLSLSAAGCGYRIDYRMSEANTPRAADPQPMAVAVALFDDTREIAERSQDGCERAGLQDCGDRTKDKDFRGTVAWEISRVVADHLTWARSFDRVELFPYRTAALTPAVLDSLNGAGIDAVLT
ncbi:MAG TPA: hypothetical protein PKY95_01955, partial [candidate division Zixibacteria bacterium]|nr:hypothetical protein [candidate division Zixibacteria bacterium]